MEYDPKTGKPSTSKTDPNNEKGRQLVCSDRRLTIRIMADILGIAKEAVRTILVENLGMQKVCAELVPWLLTPEQKARRLNVCPDIPQRVEADDKILESVITGDQSLIFYYDPETKRQTPQWKTRD